MIRALRYLRDQDRLEQLDAEQVPAALADGADPLWVDFALPTAEEVALLSNCFRFHPLAIADCFNRRHHPKVEQYGDTLFLIVHGPDASDSGRQVGSRMLASFLRGPLLVTVRLASMVWVGEVQEQARRDPREMFRAGVGHLFYSLFDRMVNQYLVVVDKTNEVVDHLEEEVLKDPSPDLLQRVRDLRRTILGLRRLLSPQREVAGKLARGDFPQINEAERYFFRNIYDHLTHIYEELDLQRDSLAGVRDAYLSVLSNRMNELGLETNQVMKVLTMVSMVLLPMGLVTGFFGMNFEHLPWLAHPWGGWLGLGFTLLPAVVVLVYYRWAGWLGR